MIRIFETEHTDCLSHSKADRTDDTNEKLVWLKPHIQNREFLELVASWRKTIKNISNFEFILVQLRLLEY